MKFNKSKPNVRMESACGALSEANPNPIWMEQSQSCARRSAPAGLLQPRSAWKPGRVRAPRLCGSPRGGAGRRRGAPPEGACFDRLLQFLEGTHLDLADALAGDAELLREILEGGRVVLEPALDKDVPLAIGQELHRLAEEVAANAELLALAEPGLLVVALV